jgi:hypothetical protein
MIGVFLVTSIASLDDSTKCFFFSFFTFCFDGSVVLIVLPPSVSFIQTLVSTVTTFNTVPICCLDYFVQ